MTRTFTPVDQAEREEIRTCVDENMCVEAGAGTGKTSVLVDRIVHLLATTNTDVRNIAVITFTEKAAAELAGRVRRGLEDARDAAADLEGTLRLERALSGLNAAHIETLHAFAASILRQRPAEANLDPRFEVLDMLPAQWEFERQYDEWLAAEMASEPPPEALVEALNLGLDPRHIREAAERLHDNRDMLPLAPYDHATVDAASVLDALAPHMATLSSLRGGALEEADEAYEELVRMVDWYADTRLRSDHASARRAIVTVRAPWHTKGGRANWRKASDCDAAKDALKRIRRILDQAKDAMRQHAVAGLVLWLQGFVRRYEQRRRQQGKADFDDLLIWSRDLIRDNQAVRAYFQAKFERIFVDEFQDTDPLQAELIISLCAEEPLPNDWHRARMRPGSLFVVGDPKQSIYRFRRADIAMYDAVKHHVFGGEPRRIVQNFRSARPIIDWVNERFALLFTEAAGVQPPYVELAARPDLQSGDAVQTLRGATPPSKGKTISSDDVRQHEARAIASLVDANVRAGSWRVRDRDGASRPASYRDIVVLVPSRTSLEIYEDEFAALGLPYRHEGGRTFFVRQEVRELVAILRAIDDAGDAVAAVAALRSSAFGCSDEDLLLHRHAGARFDYTLVGGDARGPVGDALRGLRELADLRHCVTLPELVRAVLDRTRLVEFAMLQPHGDQIAANLLKVIDQARTFAEASGRGLRGFVCWLKQNIDRASDEADASISEETDDVVRILTIHSAKGLEFPIVVFANMATTRRDDTTVIADRDAHRLHVKLGAREHGFRTPGYDEAEASEQAHTLAEERRLLYVAATRARDHLIVSLIDKVDGAPRKGVKSLNDWLRVAGADTGECIEAASLAPPQREVPLWKRPIELHSTADIARVLDERAAWIAERKKLIERASRQAQIHTASSLKQEIDETSRYAFDAIRRGPAAGFGAAVHALLERSALRFDHIDALAAAVACEFGMHARSDEMAAIARRALSSDAVRRANAARRVLLETPFTVRLAAGSLAEGRIDLLFEEDGGLVIVDFKTDAVSAREVEERAAIYRNQALTYAWASSHAAGIQAREVIFLFARPEPAIEHHLLVDDTFMVEAESLLSREPTLVS